MLDAPERTQRDVDEPRFIRQQMAGLAGIIDEMKAHRHLDEEHRAALRDMEHSYALLEERLRRAER